MYRDFSVHVPQLSVHVPEHFGHVPNRQDKTIEIYYNYLLINKTVCLVTPNIAVTDLGGSLPFPRV